MSITRTSFACLVCIFLALLNITASAAQTGEEPLDPDVLRKVRKLVKGTLADDGKEREKAWNDIHDMGNLVTPGLVELCQLKETTPAMMQSILIALGDSKDPRAGPALGNILKSPDAFVRKGAARAMGDCQYKAGLPQLETIAQNDQEDEDVRLFAAVAGAKLGGEKALAALKTLLKSEKPETRSRAVFALGKYGGIAQAVEIERALDDSDDSVREDAVEALRLLKEKPVLAGLVKAAGDANFRIRGSAMEALRDLTHEKFDNDPKLWQRWWAEHKDDAEIKTDVKKKKPSLKEPF